MLDREQVKKIVTLNVFSSIQSKVTRAITALQKYDAQRPREKRSQLFDEGATKVILQIGLKTVPSPRRNATKM